MRRWFVGVLGIAGLTLIGLEATAQKPKNPAFLDAKEAGPDFVTQGEYVTGDKEKMGAQVIARGDGKFAVVVYAGGLPGAGGDGKLKLKVDAETKGETIGFNKDGVKGNIKDGKLTLKSADGQEFVLAKTMRQSPTLGLKAPEGAVILFDGKNADEWNNGKVVEKDQLNNGVSTKKVFGDFTMHLEFRLPFQPKDRGQGRANSGLYLQDRYEVQILDSFGLERKDNECGGIYQHKAPDVNMCLPPLTWQTYDVEFTAAKFQDGKKVADAVVTLKHNGVVIHDKVKFKNSSPGGKPETDKPLGFQLQNHGNPVYFRNIWVVPRNVN